MKPTAHIRLFKGIKIDGAVLRQWWAPESDFEAIHNPGEWRPIEIVNANEDGSDDPPP
jgi:hypothetical protein